MVNANSSLSFNGTSSFEYNVAFGDPDYTFSGLGGAVHLNNSAATCYGAVNFTRNRAEYGGGAVDMFRSHLVWNTHTMTAFFNTAADGGATAA